MPLWSKNTLKTLVLPGGALLLCVTLLEYSGWLTLTLPALSFLHYCAVIGGVLLAWRFHSSRILLALVVLFLSQQAIAVFGGEQHPLTPAGLTALRTIAVLVPLDYVAISLMRERGFTASGVTSAALVLFVESVVALVLCRGAQVASSLSLRSHGHHSTAVPLLPNYTLYLIAAAGIFLTARFLLSQKPVHSAFYWSLFAFFLSLRSTGSPHVSTVYSATAACILAISIIENSYLLAYHDELTALPSRRAFNDAVLRLVEPYSIAVVDIDHFKRFNDTYGHDTGDQVLRMVAGNLSRVTGGGQAYRCGGEEFTILFPGKTTVEVVEHLERLRLGIESSEFRMRAGDRRQVPRGPDRRSERTLGRPKKGHAIRQLAKKAPVDSLSVTVSIGVASSANEESDPELVMKLADKALYRAKANGRNRLESALLKRRSRVRAAGIA